MLITYDGKTIVVIAHRAPKYGLEYWSSDASLEELINAPSEWLDVPIYRYETHARDLVRRAIKL